MGKKKSKDEEAEDDEEKKKKKKKKDKDKSKGEDGDEEDKPKEKKKDKAKKKDKDKEGKEVDNEQEKSKENKTKENKDDEPAKDKKAKSKKSKKEEVKKIVTPEASCDEDEGGALSPSKPPSTPPLMNNAPIGVPPQQQAPNNPYGFFPRNPGGFPPRFPPPGMPPNGQLRRESYGRAPGLDEAPLPGQPFSHLGQMQGGPTQPPDSGKPANLPQRPPFDPRGPPPPGYRGPWPPPIPPNYRGPWPPPPPPPNWRPGMAPAPVKHDPYLGQQSMGESVHQMDGFRPQYPPPSPSVQPTKTPGAATPRDVRLESDAVIPSGGPGNQRSAAWNSNITPLPALPDNDEDLIDYDEDAPQKSQMQRWPPPNQGYPPPNRGYPPPNQGYPPPTQGYPPPNQGRPPPNQGYPPQQNKMATEQKSVKPVSTLPLNIKFESFPKAVICPHCDGKVLTKPVSSVSGMAVGLAILLFLLFPIIFFVPLVIPSLRNINHMCPQCSNLIGQRKGGCGGK